MSWKFDSSHAVSADGAQCDRCGTVAREFAATIKCPYAAMTDQPKVTEAITADLRLLMKQIEQLPGYDPLGGHWFPCAAGAFVSREDVLALMGLAFFGALSEKKGER